VFVYECVCVCVVCVIHLSKRVENNEEQARLSASFFVTFFREKKVELCCSTLLLLRGERAFDFASLSLSLAFSFAKKNTLECSFVVYRLSDCVWWCGLCLVVLRVCFCVVRVLSLW
jgi:hypothetical protein